MPTEKYGKDLDNLFRYEYGKILSTFTRLFGIEYLELAEKIVEESYIRARANRQSRGFPKKPKDWLWNVAKIRGSEILRRENKLYDKGLDMNQISGEEFNALIKIDDDLLIENQLRMLFLSCHPSIPRESQVTLTLKWLCGFKNREIARGLCVNESAVAKRIDEGRQRIREQKIDYRLPKDSEQCQRLETVLLILNQIFANGYEYYSVENQKSVELCHESIRLTGLLLDHPQTARPETHALLSYMLIEASRFPARLDDQGKVLHLQEQVRSSWDKKMINKGLYHLDKATNTDVISEYHLRAGISACHAIADSYEKTDWKKILSLYENYLTLNNDPEVNVERAIVFSNIYGAKEGIDEIKRIRESEELKSSHLLYSTLGNLYLQLNDFKEALENYKSALKNAVAKDDQSFYGKRIEVCQNRIEMTHRYRKQKSF